jgi:hypothetical protein
MKNGDCFETANGDAFLIFLDGRALTLTSTKFMDKVANDNGILEERITHHRDFPCEELPNVTPKKYAKNIAGKYIGNCLKGIKNAN